MEELQTKVKGNFKTEAKFTTAWLKTLKDKGYYVDKISDSGILFKKIDCYIRTDKDTYCCEIKIIDDNKFPVSKLRENQWAALRNWYNLGGTSIVVVWCKKFEQYKIIPFSFIADINKKTIIELAF